MSYCRWSSDDFQCDVYCYHDVDGTWVTYVAGNRIQFAEPLPPPGDDLDFSRMQKVMDIIERSPRKPIGLPHDGECFTDVTPGQAAATLTMLRGMGYIVPQYAIDALQYEQLEGTKV